MQTDIATPVDLDELLKKADTCYEQGDHAGAIEPLDQALELTNRHPMILRALGTQLFLSKRYTWAHTIFEELTKAYPEEAGDQVHYAIAAFHNGNTDLCAAALEQALTIDPHHSDALKLSADLDLREERYCEAKTKYELIAEKHGISVECLHALAYCQFKTGDIARAKNTYEQLLEFDGEDELANHNLEVVNQAKPIPAEDRQEDLEQAQEPSSDSTHAEKSLEEADFYIQAGNHEAALAGLKQAVLLDASSPSLVEGYGSLLYSMNDFEAARTQFRKLIELSPASVDAYTRLAMACYAAGRIDEFESALGLAIEIEPENAALLQFWGKVNLEQQNYHDAGRIYAKLADLAQDNIDNLLALGTCLYHGGEIETAKIAFERALSLDPENETAIQSLDTIIKTKKCLVQDQEEPHDEPVSAEKHPEENSALLNNFMNDAAKALNEDNPDNALEIITNALEELPDHVELLNALGSLQFNLGKAEDALHTFLRKIELEPGKIETHLQVSGAAFIAENYEIFSEHLETVLNKDPENAHGLKLLASANFKSQNYTEAVKLYARLVELFPEDAEMPLALGMCFHQQGDNETAIECFKRVLEADPYNEIASGNLKALDKNRDQQEAAINSETLDNNNGEGTIKFDEQSPETVDVDTDDLEIKFDQPTPETVDADTDDLEIKFDQPTSKTDIPEVVSIGNLHKAQDLHGEERYIESWNETLKAIDLRPFHPDAYLHLAEIALCVNDEVQAKKCLERAVKLAPKWEIALNALGSLNKQTRLNQGELDWSPMPDEKDEPSVSVCMIVKNEERFLDKCLQSVREVADQIVIVDTGSTDQTVKIAESHGAEVYHFEWCDDFSAARNFALEHVRGDWVLILDADEVLSEEGSIGLKQDILQENSLGYRVRCNSLEPSENGEYKPMADAWNYIPRLARNTPGLHFSGIIHEQIFTSVNIRAAEWQMEGGFGKTVIDHYGYQPEIKQSRNKVERNIALLEKALETDPNNATLLMSYALDLFNRGDIEKALDKLRESFDLLKDYAAEDLAPEVRERLINVFVNLLLQSELYDELIEVADSQLSKDCGPTSSVLFMNAVALYKTDRAIEAIDPLYECIAKRDTPSYCSPFKGSIGVPPVHLLAECLAKKGDVDEAIKEFKNALEMDPTSAGIRHDYVKYLAHQKRAQEAIDLLNQSILSGSMDSRLWHLGSQIVNGHMEDPDIALKWTECALEECPDHNEIRKQRGIALLSAGRFEMALPFFEEETSHPLTRAARIMCQIATGKEPAEVDPAEEPTVSTAMVNWYRRLLACGVEHATIQLLKKVGLIEQTLPTAASVLREAVAEGDPQ